MRRDGDAGPGADDLGDFLGADLLAQQPARAVGRLVGSSGSAFSNCSASCLRCMVELVELLVVVLADQHAGRLLLLDRGGELVELQLDVGQLLADLLHVAQAELFRLPTARAGWPACCCSSAISSSISASRSWACSSVSSASCRAASSSCTRRRCTSSISRGHALQLHRQPAGGLVHQVDGLVGQEAVGDVAVRELGRGHQGRVLDLHALVMGLVARLQPAEDGDRVLDRRLADVDRLEAALQGGVLLDVLAVLVERGGADAAQLAAGQGRLQQVGRVAAAFGPRRRRRRCAARR